MNTELKVARSKIGSIALHYAFANDEDGITSRTRKHYTLMKLLRMNRKKESLHEAYFIGVSATSSSSSDIEIIHTLINLCKNHLLGYDIIKIQ